MAQATWILSSLSRFISLLEDSPRVSPECLDDIAPVLMPSHLRSIAEERCVQGRCGLPSCQSPVKTSPGGSQQPLYTLKMGKVLDVSIGKLFCSQVCVETYFSLQNSLSSDPPHLRRKIAALLDQLAKNYLAGPLATRPAANTGIVNVTESSADVDTTTTAKVEIKGEEPRDEDDEEDDDEKHTGPKVDVSVPSTARLWDMITSWTTPSSVAFIENPSHVVATLRNEPEAGAAANVDGYRQMPTVGSETSKLRLEALKSLLQPHFKSILRSVRDADERAESVRHVGKLLATLVPPAVPNVIEGESVRYHGTSAVDLSHKEARLLALIFIHAVSSDFVKEKLQPQIDDLNLGYRWTILSYPWE